MTLTASLTYPKAKLLILGLAFSILTGYGGPTLAFLLAKAISVYPELTLVELI